MKLKSQWKHKKDKEQKRENKREDKQTKQTLYIQEEFQHKKRNSAKPVGIKWTED